MKITVSQIRKFADKMTQCSKKIIEENRELMPIAFILHEDSETEGNYSVVICGMPFRNEDEKRALYGHLIREAQKYNAFAIVSINDSRMRKAKLKRGEQAKNLSEAEAIRRCLEAEPVDALITHISLQTGNDVALVNAYTKTEDGVVKFKKQQLLKSDSGNAVFHSSLVPPEWKNQPLPDIEDRVEVVRVDPNEL